VALEASRVAVEVAERVLAVARLWAVQPLAVLQQGLRPRELLPVREQGAAEAQSPLLRLRALGRQLAFQVRSVLPPPEQASALPAWEAQEVLFVPQAEPEELEERRVGESVRMVLPLRAERVALRDIPR